MKTRIEISENSMTAILLNFEYVCFQMKVDLARIVVIEIWCN